MSTRKDSMAWAKRVLWPAFWVLVVIGVVLVIWMAVSALTTTGHGDSTFTHTAEGADFPCDIVIREPGTYQLCTASR